MLEEERKYEVAAGFRLPDLTECVPEGGRLIVRPQRKLRATYYDTTDLRQRLGRWHDDGDATVHGWTDVWLNNDFRQWDLTEDLAYIRVPVLIVQGLQDQYGTMRQVEIAQEECYCPVEVLELPEAKHVPHREAPQKTLDTVVDFIKRALAAQSSTL